MPEPSDADGGCVLALDVGGTGMKGAVLDRRLRSVVTLRRPTPRHAGPEAVVAAIITALRHLADSAAFRGLPVHGAGVAVPGILDEQRQRAVRSVNIGWRDLPLAARLQDACGLPVVLGHDVRAGALAESRIGAARGSRNTLFVPVGTGISAAVICDGRLLRADGYAGELGHVVVEPGGRPCACGGRGCLETVASAAAVQDEYAARCGRPVDGAAEVADRVARGDLEARAVWDRAVTALASALAMATTMLAPELIVVGGGLAEAGELLLQPLRARLAEALTFQRRPLLVRAALGDRSGCLGAGLSAWEATGRPAVTEEGVVRTP